MSTKLVRGFAQLLMRLHSYQILHIEQYYLQQKRGHHGTSGVCQVTGCRGARLQKCVYAVIVERQFTLMVEK